MVMEKTVVLMKTHIWNEDIEKFASKLYCETYTHKVDFFILMHTENGQIYNNIKDDKIKKITMCFTESKIRSIYSKGFYSMWLSNHWILMWFYKKFGHLYKYFWSIEYDVRISGDSSKIWLYKSSYDFLYTMGNYRNNKNKYNNYYVGVKLKELDKYFGYLQLARYSNTALAYLDKCYSEGENGQDELITFSLLNKSGLTGSKKFLYSLIKGTWTWQNNFSEKNRKLFDYYESLNTEHLHIFHPIK
ncbi:hypothetical protein QJ857_gp0462 [Tupanvirus soda lake]|uniref:Uncharacterized protein n=2 Tax=Tupanvirus TaxID=2094720 RepID=A0A6N1NW60_9VIRU|nr:hypothetical protein QJ857_gp0462 [Tupanvirus soda lake]QKU35578.1 hypothetical protein [Tupanvirus soda lake]